MSYSDEWLKAVHAARQQPKPVEPDGSFIGEWLEARRNAKQRPPVEPVPVESTTWKPWAQMSVEERRKALSERRDATPANGPR